MRELKIKLYAHTYRDTSEIQHYVINKYCKDTMVQFKPGLLISSPAGLHHTSEVQFVEHIVQEKIPCLRQKMIKSIPCLRQKSRKTYPGWPHVPIKPLKGSTPRRGICLACVASVKRGNKGLEGVRMGSWRCI